MKKLMLGVALIVSTAAISQNSLFSNISTTDQYTEYRSVLDSDKDGVYVIRDRQYVVKFKLKRLTTGEGHSVSVIVDKGNDTGKQSTIDVLNGTYTCEGYPYESVFKNKSKREGIVAIGDYIFFLKGISDDGTSYKDIDDVYIKEGASGGSNNGTNQKKKSSFKDKMMALKSVSNPGAASASYGSEHKALESQNLRKLITDYLVAMKAKQNARTAEQKQSDKNILKAREAIVSKAKDEKAKEKAKRDAEWTEAKRYNDSIRATPEHQDLERRKRQNEANYQASKAQNDVTLRNNSSKSVYVGTSHSSNRGTEVRAGSTASWNCSQDAYIQIETVRGSTYTYAASSNKVYSANSGCGNTVNIK
jgi:hypothetical protein